MDNSRDVHTSVESERSKVGNSRDVHTSVESEREVKWATHEMFTHL